MVLVFMTVSVLSSPCVQNIFSSVMVADWQLFGKVLLTRLTVCSICKVFICSCSFLTLTILILKEWSTKFIHLNCNLIKLILQIPRPPF